MLPHRREQERPDGPGGLGPEQEGEDLVSATRIDVVAALGKDLVRSPCQTVPSADAARRSCASQLKAKAPRPTIGRLVDDAMAAIERDNPRLKGVGRTDCARPGLDKKRLWQLINLMSDIATASRTERAGDTLSRVSEYFLLQFAGAEGKKGGPFYTPTHMVRVLVEMLAPCSGRVYDPCCGLGAVFVQSAKFTEARPVDCTVALPGQRLASHGLRSRWPSVPAITRESGLP